MDSCWRALEVEILCEPVQTGTGTASPIRSQSLRGSKQNLIGSRQKVAEINDLFMTNWRQEFLNLAYKQKAFGMLRFDLNVNLAICKNLKIFAQFGSAVDCKDLAW